MAPIVEFSDWLEEECGNLARKGLRTLVLAVRVLSKEEFHAFSQRYEAAKRSLVDRDALMRTAVEDLECNLELLGLTGVEDKLQDQVSSTLATLRNAGVRVWMLTGDKVETATCIAMSANLFARNAPVFHISASTKEQAEEQFQRFQKKAGACLVIDGRSLSFCTDNFPVQFLEVAMRCPSVVCCRCAPTQKALIVRLLKRTANKRCAAIGDGGNDVAMIQAADTGIGIEGKEGKQASLAADFSITKFKHVSRLMLWHGRNSYTRTARLSQFVIHRGLIISIIQVVFSAIFYFNTIAIYSGWLVVGYSTLYTMFPVFSLVFDEDVDADTAFMYPELYQELQKGRRLCTRTFLEWTLKSIYQGASIMLLSIYLFDNSFLRIISITFTSLVLTELLMVALEVQKWQCLMVAAQFLSLACYMMSFLLLPTYFDVGFIFTWKFWSRVSAITLVRVSSRALARARAGSCSVCASCCLVVCAAPFLFVVRDQLDRLVLCMGERVLTGVVDTLWLTSPNTLITSSSIAFSILLPCLLALFSPYLHTLAHGPGELRSSFDQQMAPSPLLAACLCQNRALSQRQQPRLLARVACTMINDQ
jgi:phospholipid-translocating ATPase